MRWKAHTDKRITVKVRPGEEGELQQPPAKRSRTPGRWKPVPASPALRPHGQRGLRRGLPRVGEDAMFQVKITNSGTGPAEELMLRAK